MLCCHVLNYFMKNPSCEAHIWSKNVNSVKTKLYYGPKKSIGCSFCQIFHEKITALKPRFCQKTSILWKTLCSCAHILSKNVISLKNTVLSYHFFKLFMKNPMLSYTYFVKKTSILSKPHYNMGQKRQYDALFFPIFRISEAQ